VHLRNWPIDRLRPTQSELRHKRFVVIETTANRQIVTAVSPEVPARGEAGDDAGAGKGALRGVGKSRRLIWKGISVFGSAGVLADAV